jgi:hypothetical protein
LLLVAFIARCGSLENCTVGAMSSAFPGGVGARQRRCATSPHWAEVGARSASGEGAA